MVCVDTDCVIAWLAGDRGADVEFLDKLLHPRVVALAPVVVSELLSDPALPREAETLIEPLHQLAMDDAHGHRACKLRADLATKGFIARLADTLIAPFCVDHKIPLLSRDKGFRRFVQAAGLKLL